MTDGYSVWVAEVGIERLNRLLSHSLVRHCKQPNLMERGWLEFSDWGLYSNCSETINNE